MDIYDATVRILAEVLTLGNGILDHWVSLPMNVAGPLDPNAAVTTSGTDLVRHLASAAVGASNIMCDVVEALF